MISYSNEATLSRILLWTKGDDWRYDSIGMAESASRQPAGLRRVGIFITADALLAAIALVWGQLWQAHQLPTQYYGLAWSSFTVLLALVALAIAGWQSITTRKDEVPAIAVGLFATALEMCILNVLQSVSTTTLQSAGAIQPQFVPDAFFKVFSIVFICILISTCIYGVRNLYEPKEDQGWQRYWPWLINGSFVIALGEIVLTQYCKTLPTGLYPLLAIALPISLICLTIYKLKRL